MLLPINDNDKISNKKCIISNSIAEQSSKTLNMIYWAVKAYAFELDMEIAFIRTYQCIMKQ